MDEETMEIQTDPIAGLKAVQAARIREAFNQAPYNGHITSGGFRMDAKREDIDNLSRLKDRLLETGGADATTIRDFDNQFHTVTATQLSQIVGELVDFGLGLYSRKWELEQALTSATTEEEVLAVQW
jgi:hypothetical protein